MVAKQEDLARMTGIPRTTVNALESNRLFLSAPYALLIAEALGCRLDELYERVDGKKTPVLQPGAADYPRSLAASK